MRKILLLCCALLANSLSATQPYPLIELTEDELIATRDAVLDDLGITTIDVEAGDLLDRNELYEPSKEDVLSFLDGGPTPQRQAIVGYYEAANDKYYKYVLNINYDQVGTLVDASIVSKNKIKAPLPARPSWTCSDNNKAIELVLQDPKFRKAMKKRGLSSDDIANNIYFDVSVDGRVDNTCTSDSCHHKFDCQGLEPDLDKSPRPRVLYVTPYWNDGIADSVSAYIQPIEGVEVFVDRRSNTVIKVVDTSDHGEPLVPISKNNLDWCRPPRNSLKPIVMNMPDGPSYTLNEDRVVEWENWKFSFAFHPRYGLALHNVTYNDRTGNYNDSPVPRSVLYRAHISELITAYGTPDFPLSIRNFLDISEYPAVSFLPPLMRNIDIPPYAQTFPFTFMIEDGSTLTIDDAFAIYEQDAGVLWRHIDFPCCTTPSCDNIYQGRRARQLVITYATVISNYDYNFYWILSQDGNIEMQIKPSGVIETLGKLLVKAEPNQDNYGNLVQENVVGVNHLHTFCARLDFDLDGQDNRVYENEVKVAKPSKENPCQNAWFEEERLLTTESDAVRDHNFEKGRTWTIENDESLTRLGYPRAYELVPTPVARNLIQPTERIAKHASYTLHNLFVTRYKREEMDVLGEFPVEQPKDEGIAKAIKDDQKIVDKDIVVWYTSGLAHAPRVEDYPVMPSEIMGFSLRPHSFFNENPGLDVDQNKLYCPDGSPCCAPPDGYSCEDHGINVINCP